MKDKVIYFIKCVLGAVVLWFWFFVAAVLGSCTSSNHIETHQELAERNAELVRAYNYIIELEDAIDNLDDCYLLDVVAERDAYQDFYNNK